MLKRKASEGVEESAENSKQGKSSGVDTNSTGESLFGARGYLKHPANDVHVVNSSSTSKRHKRKQNAEMLVSSSQATLVNAAETTSQPYAGANMGLPNQTCQYRVIYGGKKL